MKITLCGSTKFKKEYEEWNKKLSLSGHLVYSVGYFEHSGDVLTDGQKEILDLMHLQKILESDAIYVLDVDEYIGSSTAREIKWAEMNNKTVYRLSRDYYNTYLIGNL